MAPSDHLFRRESGRMVAALVRVFGVHNLALADDVVQDAFCRAVEVWRFRGVPENPAAWLMATAKHRALDVLRRERTAQRLAPELGRFVESEWTLAPVVEELFAPGALRDDLLRMMFSCCHPRLVEPAQVALILHILCGFGAGEIAAAFVISEAAAQKRISRAKKILAASKRLFDVTASADFTARLPAVQRALYLLFNEGYHGASAETAVRAELCQEAMRLAALLLDHPQGAMPETQALMALMCLGAARLPGRIDAGGDLIPFFEQVRCQWDQRLIDEGLKFLAHSAIGEAPSQYHIEAAIAAIHACATGAQDTDWAAILGLYEELVRLRPSPVVELNRAIAIAQCWGPQSGLEAIRTIRDADRLAQYPFYSAAQGELELRCGHPTAARRHFEAALTLARNPMERRFLARRRDACVA